MNQQSTKLGLLVGRIIAGLFYLHAGIDNLAHLSDKVDYAALKGAPLPWLTVTVASLLLIIGGASILTGYKPIVGITAIILFLLPVTFYMHDFWAVADPQMRVEEVRSFLSNMGLTGSTLIFLAIPRPWPWSLEALASAADHDTTLPETVL